MSYGTIKVDNIETSAGNADISSGVVTSVNGQTGAVTVSAGVTGTEGTFTPSHVSGFNSTVYFDQDGYYYKIGQFVHFSLKVGFDAMATYRVNSDPFRIGGLPFTSNDESEYTGGAVITKSNYGGGFDNFHVSIPANSTEIRFYDDFTEFVSDSVSHNYKYMYISGYYMTS